MLEEVFMKKLAMTAVLLVASAGCAASSEEHDLGEDESAVTADPRTELAKKVDHIAFTALPERVATGPSTIVLGAPKKIADIFKAIDGRFVALPAGSAPRCPPRVSLSMFDRSGQKLASVTQCGGDRATLVIGSNAFEVPARETKLREIAGRERSVGDLLYGITKIVTADGDEGTEPGEVAMFLAPLDRDAVPEVRNGQPRCMPKATITYVRGTDVAAKATLYCPQSPESTKVDAMLDVNGNKSWVIFDLSRIDIRF